MHGTVAPDGRGADRNAKSMNKHNNQEWKTS